MIDEDMKSDGNASAEDSGMRDAPELNAERGELESLAAGLEAARNEAAVFRDEAARAKADFYNYRTRVERDRARDRALAAESAVLDLLPVLDNLERALDAESDKESSMYKGISMVKKQFFAALQNLGLREVDTSGAFDPSMHEAVMTVGTDSADGAVLEVLGKGYMLGEKVLRPARVKIGVNSAGETGGGI